MKHKRTYKTYSYHKQQYYHVIYKHIFNVFVNSTLMDLSLIHINVKSLIFIYAIINVTIRFDFFDTS